MITNLSTYDLLLVFAKYPRAGKVKTRLAATIGAAEAVRVYRALTETVMAKVKCGEYVTRIMYAPQGRGRQFGAWLGTDGLSYTLQRGDSLGERLERAARQGKEKGARGIALIGTDCPFVDEAVVTAAFSHLRKYDAVIGPTEDGGYYLLAFRDVHACLFKGIDWSTGRVCAQTLGNASAAGLRVKKLPVLFDVDTADDLARWERMR